MPCGMRKPSRVESIEGDRGGIVCVTVADDGVGLPAGLGATRPLRTARPRRPRRAARRARSQVGQRHGPAELRLSARIPLRRRRHDPRAAGRRSCGRAHRIPAAAAVAAATDGDRRGRVAARPRASGTWSCRPTWWSWISRCPAWAASRRCGASAPGIRSARILALSAHDDPMHARRASAGGRARLSIQAQRAGGAARGGHRRRRRPALPRCRARAEARARRIRRRREIADRAALGARVRGVRPARRRRHACSASRRT